MIKKVKIIIKLNTRMPLYKQLVKVVQDNVNDGKFKEGDFLPSMNELAEELNISKETVKKAYSVLREMKIIDSSQGRGFYISNKNGNKIKALLLFDTISTYKRVLFNSFAETIKDRARITIHLHNQDIDLFEFFVNENLDKFDYYIITPHFPLNPDIQKRAVKILKRIPNRKLILLDRYVEGLSGNFGSVYQDFENDVFDGLMQGVDLLRKYKRLNVISMPGSMYAPLLQKGIERFCTKNLIKYDFRKNLTAEKIQKRDVFLILNSQLDNELLELVRIAKQRDYIIGKDIGIISYNESPINEIVLNGLTVLSTDFKQMGEIAANMIIKKSFKKVRCDFSLIRRSTL